MTMFSNNGRNHEDNESDETTEPASGRTPGSRTPNQSLAIEIGVTLLLTLCVLVACGLYIYYR